MINQKQLEVDVTDEDSLLQSSKLQLVPHPTLTLQLLTHSFTIQVGNSYLPAMFECDDLFPSFYQIFQIKFKDSRGWCPVS